MREYIIYVTLVFLPIGLIMAYLLYREGISRRNIAIIVTVSGLIVMSFPIGMERMGTFISLLSYIIVILVMTRYLLGNREEYSLRSRGTLVTGSELEQLLADMEMEGYDISPVVEGGVSIDNPSVRLESNYDSVISRIEKEQLGSPEPDLAAEMEQDQDVSKDEEDIIAESAAELEPESEIEEAARVPEQMEAEQAAEGETEGVTEAGKVEDEETSDEEIELAGPAPEEIAETGDLEKETRELEGAQEQIDEGLGESIMESAATGAELMETPTEQSEDVIQVAEMTNEERGLKESIGKIEEPVEEIKETEQAEMLENEEFGEADTEGEEATIAADSEIEIEEIKVLATEKEAIGETTLAEPTPEASERAESLESDAIEIETEAIGEQKEEYITTKETEDIPYLEQAEESLPIEDDLAPTEAEAIIVEDAEEIQEKEIEELLEPEPEGAPYDEVKIDEEGVHGIEELAEVKAEETTAEESTAMEKAELEKGTGEFIAIEDESVGLEDETEELENETEDEIVEQSASSGLEENSGEQDRVQLALDEYEGINETTDNEEELGTTLSQSMTESMVDHETTQFGETEEYVLKADLPDELSEEDTQSEMEILPAETRNEELRSSDEGVEEAGPVEPIDEIAALTELDETGQREEVMEETEINEADLPDELSEEDTQSEMEILPAETRNEELRPSDEGVEEAGPVEAIDEIVALTEPDETGQKEEVMEETEINEAEEIAAATIEQGSDLSSDANNEHILELIDQGFSFKEQHFWLEAARCFETAWELTGDDELKYLLGVELMAIYESPPGTGDGSIN